MYISILDQWIGKSNFNGLVSLQHRLISLQQLPNWSSTITKLVFSNYYAIFCPIWSYLRATCYILLPYCSRVLRLMYGPLHARLGFYD